MGVPRRIFVFWAGPPMNANRRRGLGGLQAESGVEVVLVTDENLAEWLVPERPLSDAFDLLSENHRSDYLRAYLLHHHGGGYSDVKPTTGSWVPAFEELDADERLLGSGYPETNRSGVASLGLELRRKWDLQPTRRAWWHYRWLQLRHRSLIGNTAFIYRPGTEFTQSWLSEVERRVDALRDALAREPARVPKERAGLVYDGRPSRYPVPWSHLMGDVHHPLVYRYRRRIAQSVPPSDWIDYQ